MVLGRAPVDLGARDAPQPRYRGIRLEVGLLPGYRDGRTKVAAAGFDLLGRERRGDVARPAGTIVGLRRQHAQDACLHLGRILAGRLRLLGGATGDQRNRRSQPEAVSAASEAAGRH